MTYLQTTKFCFSLTFRQRNYGGLSWLRIQSNKMKFENLTKGFGSVVHQMLILFVDNQYFKNKSFI